MTPPRLPLRACLLAACCLLAAGAAPARELGFVTIEAAPWAYREAGGDPAGAFPEIVRALEQRTGLRMRIALYPLARVEQAMATGSQDCTIILWNEARAPHVLRGEAVYPMPFGVIAAPGLPLAHYEDLAALRISVTRGLSMNPRFDADPALRKDHDRDYLTGLRKIAHGRSDAIAGALPTIRHIARTHGLETYLGSTLPLGEVPLTLQCSRHAPVSVDLPVLDAALRAMRADGSLARILAGHGYH